LDAVSNLREEFNRPLPAFLLGENDMPAGPVRSGSADIVVLGPVLHSERLRELLGSMA
jgi:hypothetical protein